MLRLGKLRNKNQKRTLRVLYGQTQAYPYAATLASTLFNSDGSFHAPLASDTDLPDRTVDAFTYKSGLLAGTVLIKHSGETVKVAIGSTGERPFGLLANNVGGELDEVGDERSVGVWRGPDAVVEVLAPAFNPTGITSAALSTAADAGSPILLYAGTDGRLSTTNPGAGATAVGRLLDAAFSGTTPTRVVVELAI
jgi:hypothetical protein